MLPAKNELFEVHRTIEKFVHTRTHSGCAIAEMATNLVGCFLLYAVGRPRVSCRAMDMGQHVPLSTT